MSGDGMRRGNRARPSTAPTTPSDGANPAAAAAAEETTPGKSNEEQGEVSTTRKGGGARDNSTATEEEEEQEHKTNMVLDEWDGVVPRAVKDIFKLAREGLSEAVEAPAPAVTACEQPYRSTSPPDSSETLAESRPPTVSSDTRTGWAPTSRTTTGSRGSGLGSLDDTIPNPETSPASWTPGEATRSPGQALTREGSRGARVSSCSGIPGTVRGVTAREGSEKRGHGETSCSVECSYMQVGWGVLHESQTVHTSVQSA